MTTEYIHKTQGSSPLLLGLNRVSFFPFFFIYKKKRKKKNYKARAPFLESRGNQHIICIIWPDRCSGFRSSAITPRGIMRPAHVTQRQLKSPFIWVRESLMEAVIAPEEKRIGLWEGGERRRRKKRGCVIVQCIWLRSKPLTEKQLFHVSPHSEERKELLWHF